MANLTEDGNYTTTSPEVSCIIALGAAQRIFLLATNIPLSIVAFVGNFLIIVTLRKVSCLHPPSKLLLGCLAGTDLGVGLNSQPLFIVFFMSSEHSKGCYYSSLLLNTIGSIFISVSLLTMTAISVDRLLALLLGLRYRQVVTVRRVRLLVFTFWVLSTLNATVFLYSIHIAISITCAALLLCLMISSFCYTKIYRTLRLSEAQVQDQGPKGKQNGEGIQLNKARYRKTVSTALWLQMALFACCLPYGLVYGFILISGINTHFLKFVSYLAFSLLLFNSTLNPFLYCWKMREMRQAVKHTIRRFFRLLTQET
ncbi:adenosine receptor A3-like [Stylophora pistillata]|uniref:adenosine receptor A3-like n=1 Tax=Stylophora pistillata TaxID=50429 RepID=UPI000C04A1F1|nr:adenosine receptor A3-like [Stylophora pistillata]XP_022789580.1 adenosine receptor A3-like [Stylophora pistillata]